MARGPQLKTVGDVASFLARITREAYVDKLEMDKAKGLGYLCGQLRAALETSDLEARLEALENVLDERVEVG